MTSAPASSFSVAEAIADPAALARLREALLARLLGGDFRLTGDVARVLVAEWRLR